MNNDKKCFYTVGEFSSKLGVHPNTIRNAIKNNRISALRLGGGKRARYLIPYSEVDRLVVIDVNKFLEKK